MKKLLSLTLVAFMLIGGFYSCDDDYDDSALWEQTNENTDAIEDLEAAVQALEDEINAVAADLENADLETLAGLVDRVLALETSDASTQAAIQALTAQLTQVIQERIVVLEQMVGEDVAEAIEQLQNLLENLSDNNLTIFYYDYYAPIILSKAMTGDWQSIEPTINEEDGAEAEYRIVGVRPYWPDIHGDQMPVPAGNGGDGGTIIGEWWLEYFSGYDTNPWFVVDKYTGVVTPIEGVDIPVGEYVIGVMAVDRKNIGCCDFLAIRTIEFESVKDLDVILDPMSITFRKCGDADDIDWEAVSPYLSTEVDLVHILGPYSGNFMGIDNEINDFRITVTNTCEFPLPCHMDSTFYYNAVFMEEIDVHNNVVKPFSVTVLPEELDWFNYMIMAPSEGSAGGPPMGLMPKQYIHINTCADPIYKVYDLNNYIPCDQRANFEITYLNGVPYNDDIHFQIVGSELHVTMNDRELAEIYAFWSGVVKVELRAIDYYDPSITIDNHFFIEFVAHDQLISIDHDDMNFDEHTVSEIDIPVTYDDYGYDPGMIEVTGINIQHRITDASTFVDITGDLSPNPLGIEPYEEFGNEITLENIDDLEPGTYIITINVRDKYSPCITDQLVFRLEINPECIPEDYDK